MNRIRILVLLSLIPVIAISVYGAYSWKWWRVWYKHRSTKLVTETLYPLKIIDSSTVDVGRTLEGFGLHLPSNLDCLKLETGTDKPEGNIPADNWLHCKTQNRVINISYASQAEDNSENHCDIYVNAYRNAHPLTQSGRLALETKIFLAPMNLGDITYYQGSDVSMIYYQDSLISRNDKQLYKWIICPAGKGVRVSIWAAPADREFMEVFVSHIYALNKSLLLNKE